MAIKESKRAGLKKEQTQEEEAVLEPVLPAPKGWNPVGQNRSPSRCKGGDHWGSAASGGASSMALTRQTSAGKENINISHCQSLVAG